MSLIAYPATFSEKHHRHEPRRLVLVSNRGPIEHYLTDTGRIKHRDAGGGVAVALGSIAEHTPVTWIAGAGTLADRVLALSAGTVPMSNGSDLKLVYLPDEAHAAFYESFCNPLLWFVQHSIAGDLRAADWHADAYRSWQTGYLPVNRMFADAVIEEIDAARGDAHVMLHDYHLYVAPRLIRAARPDALLQQFIHIPWPEPSDWWALPDALVREICQGLLANDSLVFQTDESVANFFATCRVYLGAAASVSERRNEARYAGQTTSVWSNPISLNVDEMQSLAASDEVQGYVREIEAIAGEKTIVRVDRLDPSKNVLRGFEAFELLLQRRRNLRGKVRFLAFMVPSRTGIPEYDGYAREVMDLIASINERYGTRDWQPIQVFYEQNRAQAIAGLCLYDALLVNSVADGMNLVSKEGPVVNRRDGVLLLSRTAGSHEELGDGALCLDPFDVPGTAAAMEMALEMRPEARVARARRLRAAIGRHQLTDWLQRQMKDLAVADYVRNLTIRTA